MKHLWLVLILVLVACGPDEKPAPPLPTLADSEAVAATLGLPAEEDMAATMTARVPTITPSNTPITPTFLPTETPSITPSVTFTPSITVNPIEATITAIYHLTQRASTEQFQAPTASLTFTPSVTWTPTPLPSHTLAPTLLPVLPDNPEPNAILFSSNRAGSTDIWVMPPTGGSARPLVLTANNNEYIAACHPRGLGLMFDTDRGGDREIYLADYIGPDARPLTDTIGENHSPAWSPQGDLVAFVSTRSGNADIWIMDFGGGNARQITSSVGDEIMPSWSADGNVIFYSSNRNGDFDIFQFNLDANQESQVTFTSEIDELYPILSPDFLQLAYVAEVTRGDPSTGAVFITDGRSEPRPAVVSTGRVEMPQWINNTQMLVAADTEEGVHILLVDLSANTSIPLTTIGRSNRWPMVCYVEPSIFEQLPQAPPTPRVPPTAIPPTVPSTFIAEGDYAPAATPPESGWIITRETWTGPELASIAPSASPITGGFLIGNLLSLTWSDAAGQHIVTIAFEVFEGELTATLIGYTINDLPGPIGEVIGLETQMRDQLLRNSLRPGSYHAFEIVPTEINTTFAFLVPPQLDPIPGEGFEVFVGDLPAGWLISTERWTPGELALLAGVDTVVLSEEQILYQWQDDGFRQHELALRYEAQNGDLVLVPLNYTIDGESADMVLVEDRLAANRRALLRNSIVAGRFSLTEVSFIEGGINMIFRVPPLQ